MGELAAIRLSVVLCPGSDPVEGSITLEGGQPIAFTGWMPLLSILEAANAGELERRAGTSVRSEPAAPPGGEGRGGAEEGQGS